MLIPFISYIIYKTLTITLKYALLTYKVNVVLSVYLMKYRGIMGEMKMTWLHDFAFDKKSQTILTTFLKQYGTMGLNQALQFYSYYQQDYICKNKTSISKFKICDIYYLEIHEHNITIHTIHGIFQKYGSLNKELKILSHFNFIKCSQNCIVSLDKIRTICNNSIILNDNTKIHMSRNYTPKVIIAFSRIYG